MTEHKNKDIIVDAVITWVDGNDLAWQKKINEYKEVKIDFNNQSESVRYNSIGEINIAIRSIIKFAPFVRNIFLVTDNQVPEGYNDLVNLAQNSNIHLKIIDHKVIFRDFEEVLPCFNSCSIGNVLYRIPELSEHFIIFNDDTFLMRSTTVSDFFKKGGIPIIRGDWESYNENKPLRKLYHSLRKTLGKGEAQNKISFKKFQQRSAKLAGTKRYVRRYHTPVCVRKSTLELFFKDRQDLLLQNIKHRFRNSTQFIISSLSEHLEISKETYYYSKKLNLTYFRSYKSTKSVKKKLDKFLKDRSKIFMTFQSLEKANDETFNYIKNWIETRLS